MSDGESTNLDCDWEADYIQRTEGGNGGFSECPGGFTEEGPTAEMRKQKGDMSLTSCFAFCLALLDWAAGSKVGYDGSECDMQTNFCETE